MLTCALSVALTLGLVAEPRITFESPAEPVPVIVSRLAEELNMPLTSAQKLSDERLVIYAPDVEARELLDQIAYALFAEWVPRSDGTLLLDRFPAGERQQSRVGHSLSSAPENWTRPSSIVQMAEPLTRERADRIAAEFGSVVALAENPNLIDEALLATQQLAQESPLHRLAARMLLLLPADFWAHPPQSTLEDPVPDAVISTSPSTGEVSARAVRESLLQQFRAEEMSWQQMVDYHELASVPMSDENFLAGMLSLVVTPSPLRRSLEQAAGNTIEVGEVALRVFRDVAGIRAELMLFDATGLYHVKENVTFVRDGLIARDPMNEGVEPWLADQTTLPAPRLNGNPAALADWFAAAGGIHRLHEFQLEAARHIGQALGVAVVQPVLMPQAYFRDATPDVNLAPVLELWQSASVPSGGDPMLAGARHESGWLVLRRFDGPTGRSLFDWRKADHEKLQQTVSAVMERGRLTMLDYVRLAGATDSSLLYSQMLSLFRDQRIDLEWRPGRVTDLSFDDAKMLDDLIGSDSRRLQSGVRRGFHQLSNSGKEAVARWVYSADFVAPSFPSYSDVWLRGGDMADYFGLVQEARHIHRLPTSVFPQGIPSQAEVSLESFDRYDMQWAYAVNGEARTREITIYMYAWALFQAELNNTEFAYPGVTLATDRIYRITLRLGEFEMSRELTDPGVTPHRPVELSTMPEDLRKAILNRLERDRAEHGFTPSGVQR